MRPLCTAYNSPMYTQEMQEFLSKKTTDFDPEQVLNMDEDESNNFAVFSDKTVVVPQTAGKNHIAKADDEKGVYVIENADDTFKSLKQGDIFSYQFEEDDFLVVKVGSIEIKGDTVTIVRADTSLEEAFEYVKIDTASTKIIMRGR